MKFRSIRDLLTDKELEAVHTAPLIATGRFPTWYPIFYSEPRTVDYLSNGAVALICSEGDEDWLRSLAPRLCRIDDPEEASAALAELRAYGAFLEAGFKVKPIPVKDDSTPDFEVDAGDGPLIVEVFAKHQDESETERWEDLKSGKTPEGVERQSSKVAGGEIETVVSTQHPGGAPDPDKANDSVQANVISRICAAKGKEKQFPTDKPSLLWIDLRSFGVWPEAVGLEQCTPLMSGHHGLTSGALWYAFYGWKDAPIFEEDFPLHERVVKMGHDGRFRLQGKKKSKLSGAIVALPDGLVLFENPWPNHALPDQARRYAERLPWFNLGHSVCSWSPGDAEVLAEAGHRQIEAMKKWRDKLDRS
ncbi:MAG: hypothetical protein ACTHM2_10165 [Afipia sp.]